jgi:hypothetical protein
MTMRIFTDYTPLDPRKSADLSFLFAHVVDNGRLPSFFEIGIAVKAGLLFADIKSILYCEGVYFGLHERIFRLPGDEHKDGESRTAYCYALRWRGEKSGSGGYSDYSEEIPAEM